MTALLDAYLAARAAGLNPYPPRQDGSKAPDASEWTSRMTTMATEAEARRWCSNGRTGLGLICGAVSGGLEMFEFEGRAVNEGLNGQFLEAAEAAGLGDVLDRVVAGYMETTPTGGVHLLYRCDEPKSVKLASRPATAEELAQKPDDRWKTLIETKGEGGYVIVAPSNGAVHETGLPWELRSGGFATIATITAEERAELHRLAATFDQMPKAKAREPRTERSSGQAPLWELTPGDDFAARVSWAEILEPHGWRSLFTTHGGNQHWCRPGKERGTSATIDANGEGTLYVFTSSALPFELKTAYSRFGAFAELEHGGDHSAAYKALEAEGYGKRAEKAEHRGVGGGGRPDQTGGGGRPDPGGRPGARFKLTDYGNAERLVHEHGADLRFDHNRGRWLCWDGRRWADDETGEAVRRGKTTVRGLWSDLAGLDDDKERQALARHAARSEAEGRIRAAVTLAATEPGIAVRVEELDADPWALTCLNGTLDLRTGELRAHRRKNLITKLAPVSFDPGAVCPAWLAFLDRVLGGEAELIGFLRRAIGYSLTGITTEQVMFLLHGGGANGKSTFLEVVRALLGDYAQQTPAETFLAKREGGVPNDVARLRGARFVSAVESDEGRRLAEATVKQITGGDAVAARYMRAEWFEFTPVCKLWLATNHRPQVRGTDEAVWRRLRLVPFDVTIPEAERDPLLPSRLRAELPGILAWAVAGCREWQASGLGVPAQVRAATGAYREEMDALGAFLSEECITMEGATVSAAELYGAYRRWSEAAGEHPGSQRRVGAALTERGFERRKHGPDRRWHWFALGLVNPSEASRTHPTLESA